MLAGLHFTISVILFCGMWEVAMLRFDYGGEPAMWESHAEAVLGLMHLPLVVAATLLPFRLPLFLLVCADSLLWGFGVAWAIDWLKQVLSRSAS